MTAVLEVDRLVKRFGETVAVDGVSFSIQEGEAFGYLGPNGSGKTTTMRCALGLVRPTTGGVSLFGRDAARGDVALLADVGHLPGEFGLWPSMTGRECLDFLASISARAPASRADLCDRFDLSGSALDRQVRQYSRGMKQKIGIIQAFQHAPKLVVLDEPTEGLDPVMKGRFVDLLADHQRAGGTVFLSSHILGEVERATQRVGILRAGRLVKVGATAAMSGERIRHCTLVFKEQVNDELAQLPGVSELRVDTKVAHFDFRGDMEPLLRMLGTLRVEEFLAEPETLTEAFFDVYQEGAP